MKLWRGWETCSTWGVCLQVCTSPSNSDIWTESFKEAGRALFG